MILHYHTNFCTDSLPPVHTLKDLTFGCWIKFMRKALWNQLKEISAASGSHNNQLNWLLKGSQKKYEHQSCYWDPLLPVLDLNTFHLRKYYWIIGNVELFFVWVMYQSQLPIPYSIVTGLNNYNLFWWNDALQLTTMVAIGSYTNASVNWLRCCDVTDIWKKAWRSWKWWREVWKYAQTKLIFLLCLHDIADFWIPASGHTYS